MKSILQKVLYDVRNNPNKYDSTYRSATVPNIRTVSEKTYDENDKLVGD